MLSSLSPSCIQIAGLVGNVWGQGVAGSDYFRHELAFVVRDECHQNSNRDGSFVNHHFVAATLQFIQTI